MAPGFPDLPRPTSGGFWSENVFYSSDTERRPPGTGWCSTFDKDTGEACTCWVFQQDLDKPTCLTLPPLHAMKEAATGLKGETFRRKNTLLPGRKAKTKGQQRIGEQENGELNKTQAPTPNSLPNFCKWGLVLELFPNVWKHLEEVVELEQKRQEVVEGDLEPDLQPWVLLCKDN
ncbi:hypothetical protein JB92DRAFT_2828060 [Gautieria morchelliformis]|nr:hypothetical protein JB92DRAFT_2828060 [Gautieria morchelliformis]